MSCRSIEFDPDKRDKTLTQRGLDFAHAGEVFAGVNVTAEDARFDYGEPTAPACCWTARRRPVSARPAPCKGDDAAGLLPVLPARRSNAAWCPERGAGGCIALSPKR